MFHYPMPGTPVLSIVATRMYSSKTDSRDDNKMLCFQLFLKNPDKLPANLPPSAISICSPPVEFF